MMMQVKGIRYSAQLFLYLCDKLGCRSLKGWTVKAVVPGPVRLMMSKQLRSQRRDSNSMILMFCRCWSFMH